MMKSTASLGAALLLAAFGIGRIERADAQESTQTLPSASESTTPQPATTDPVTGPPLRRGTAPNPYWDEHGKWYDSEHRAYSVRYYGRMPVQDVELHRARSGLGSTRRSGPYHRAHYLFYERDRRFNPHPYPGGGHNYNLVW